MNRLKVLSGSSSLLGCVVGAAALALAVSGFATGCGGDKSQNTGGAGGATSSSGAANGGGNPTGGGQGGNGEGGGAATACKKNAGGPTRGAAIAVSPDDSRVVSVNRDAGTVTVTEVTYGGAAPKLAKVAELKVGNEPWQVAIDGCGKRAYVVLRKDQKVVTIDDLDGDPKVGESAPVGSEPTSLALTPDNGELYVANWVDGTLTVLDGFTLKPTGAAIDLNGALANAPAKYLGDSVKSRPALAHPRSLAITADGKKVYATEFFGQRTRPESTGGTIDPNVDTTHEGVVYAVDTASGTSKTVSLAPLTVTGFTDHNNADTGCYANQLQGITINGSFAYVTAICASPKGPLGVFQKQACVVNADCANNSCNTTVGACNGGCNPAVNGDADCAANLDGATGVCVGAGAIGACKGVTADVKATTHPVMFVIDTTADAEVVSDPSFANLDKGMWDLYSSAPASPDDATRRMPLVANEITFIPGTKVGYVSANGADAVFRFTYDDTGKVVSVGGDKGTEFINLAPTTFDPDNTALKGVGPIGLFAAHSTNNKFLFTDNDITRNVSAVDLPSQKVAGGAKPVVEQASVLPTDPTSVAKINGKKFFNTGLARWSLKGQGWGACQSCHVDGLTDNVSWYFNRGIRQTVSLDGSFSKAHPDTDQRIFNWTAIFDEVSDFENNTRGVSGGVGALVSTASTPPALTDRINLNDATAFGPSGANSLNGSTVDIDENISEVKANWESITAWIKTVRSPRAPSNLDPQKVSAGEAVFKDGNCKGCHSGDKWTISTLFYAPTNGGAAANPNDKLVATSWEGVVTATNENFPASMLPAPAGSRNMRTVGNPTFAEGSQKSLSFDQLLCILRPVGTFGVSPAEVGVIELRQDMATPGQGAGTSDDGDGFNPPSLLNLQAGAPYFHGGNARTLEEAFDSNAATFAAHYDAIKTDENFLLGSSDVDNLVAYLLSIDGDKTTVAIPTLPATPPALPTAILGGDYCSTTSTP